MSADPAQLGSVDHHGTATVAAAAARDGLEGINYLTGGLVREEYGRKIPVTQTTATISVL